MLLGVGGAIWFSFQAVYDGAEAALPTVTAAEMGCFIDGHIHTVQVAHSVKRFRDDW